MTKLLDRLTGKERLSNDVKKKVEQRIRLFVQEYGMPEFNNAKALLNQPSLCDQDYLSDFFRQPHRVWIEKLGRKSHYRFYLLIPMCTDINHKVRFNMIILNIMIQCPWSPSLLVFSVVNGLNLNQSTIKTCFCNQGSRSTTFANDFDRYS